MEIVFGSVAARMLVWIMLRIFVTLVITVCLSGLAIATAQADETKCRVMDPTGSPLNVRTSPHGRIIGNLPNDMLVAVVDRTVDRTGKPWVYISKFSDGKPIGWVYRKFISCAD
jgi:hypothetical protein